MMNNGMMNGGIMWGMGAVGLVPDKNTRRHRTAEEAY